MQEQIIRINWFADDDCTIDPITKQKTVNLDKRHLYRNLKMLGELEMIRLVQAAQFCTGGEYADYNPKRKKRRKFIVKRIGNVWEDIVQMPKVRVIWRIQIWY